MCGFVGYLGASKPPTFERALMSIQHRGPDETSTLSREGIHFGFARLAILEIQDGHQPFEISNEDIVIVFNGEIYNYQNIRKELQENGVAFRGRSEAEVLARGYSLWREELFSKLRGMFAIAIWNAQEKTLVLVRDPLGKKPLYWSHSHNEFAFSSEIKAIWNLASVDFAKIDKTALAGYLISDSIPTPLSVDERIHKLEPGTILKWNKNSVTTRKFWPNSKSFASPLPEEVEVEFYRRITESVKRRLISDGPVGIFLSSGIDSRAVASIVAKNSKQQISSFTLKFEASFDESKEAEESAREFKFEHRVIDASDEKLAEMWTIASKVIDEPLNDPAILPMMLMSREASKSVKVAITGDGGDELFLGYPHQKLHRIPAVGWPHVFSPLKVLLNCWPDNQNYFSLGFRLQRFARGVGIRDLCQRDLSWRGSFTLKNIVKLLSQNVLSQIDVAKLNEGLSRDYVKSPVASSMESRLSWWYLRTYLMDTVLVKVDRASMAFGLECRSPLLDLDVVEFVLSSREQNLLKQYPAKSLLKSIVVMSGFRPLPKIKKHGMGVPVVRMLKSVLKEEFESLTNLDLIESQGIFCPKTVMQLKQDFYSGRRDIRKEIWSIFAFQTWLREFNIPLDTPNR